KLFLRPLPKQRLRQLLGPHPFDLALFDILPIDIEVSVDHAVRRGLDAEERRGIATAVLGASPRVIDLCPPRYPSPERPQRPPYRHNAIPLRTPYALSPYPLTVAFNPLTL